MNPLLEEQRKVLARPSTVEPLEPVTVYDLPEPHFRSKGVELLQQGKVACLVLAGGQATRLGLHLPKAVVPVTQQKTLLQLLCEKTRAASSVFQTPLPLAIMTSTFNREEIENYLKTHSYFGIPHQIHLFSQENAPFLSEEGNWIYDSHQLVVGPDGNGHSLRQLMQSGIGKTWLQKGIEAVTVVPIDNPLADPFDATFIGYHALKNHDISLKAILRNDPSEKVGVLVRRNGRLSVQEYSELPAPFEAPLANINLFCFALAFIETAAPLELPWHAARKKYRDEWIWKFERFLFDMLDHTDRTGALVYPREETYAPVKNPQSLATAREAFQDFTLRWMAQLTKGSLPPEDEFDWKLYYGFYHQGPQHFFQ